MAIDSSEEVVLSYMKTQNRPYSVQNVFDNLRGEVSKPKVSSYLEVRSISLSLSLGRLV